MGKRRGRKRGKRRGNDEQERLWVGRKGGKGSSENGEERSVKKKRSGRKG